MGNIFGHHGSSAGPSQTKNSLEEEHCKAVKKGNIYGHHKDCHFSIYLPPPFFNNVIKGLSLNDVECPQCRMTQSGFRNIRSCRNNHHYCRLCYQELYESRRPCLICGVDMGSQ